MSDRLYAYLPIKKNKDTLEFVASSIQEKYPEASINRYDNDIHVLSKYYPVNIQKSENLSNCWEIFVWHNYYYLFTRDEEDLDNRRFLKDICSILGSNECWHINEISFDYADDYFECIWSDKDLPKLSIEYSQVTAEGFDWNKWSRSEFPFVHDTFENL